MLPRSRPAPHASNRRAAPSNEANMNPTPNLPLDDRTLADLIAYLRRRR
jgi:hypothetical protein